MIKNILITSFVFAMAILIWSSKDSFHPSSEEISMASLKGLFFGVFMYLFSQKDGKKRQASKNME